MSRVQNAITQDTRRDVAPLMNEIGPKHGVDPELLLALAIAERNLTERGSNDHGTSWGLYNAHLPSYPNAGTAAQFEDARYATEWAAPHLKYCLDLASGDWFGGLCRWNRPTTGVVTNAVAASYSRALKAAEAYRVTEDGMPDYLFGFKDYHARHPTEVGEPTENEHGVTARFNVQETTRGLLVYSRRDNGVRFVSDSAPAPIPGPAPDAGVVWRDSPNFTPGRPNGAPVALVLHTMSGTLAGSDSWFANSASQVSAHYGIGLDGTKHQYVRLSDSAWANGVLEAGNVWESLFGRAWPNGRTVSVETEDRGNANEPVTDAQYNATVDVCTTAMETYPSITHLVGHKVISPQSRPNCCGARWWGSGRFDALAVQLGLHGVR